MFMKTEIIDTKQSSTDKMKVKVFSLFLYDKIDNGIEKIFRIKK